MKSTLMMDFSVDKEDKRISVKREFAAEISRVWDAFTKSEILDQWWAPRPWKARTKKMEFREGGYWLYAMVGPEGEEHWARADYHEIKPEHFFRATDGFCDPDGNINKAMPMSEWNCSFTKQSDHTVVAVDIRFEDLAHLETTIQMGFREGFVVAMEGLDEVLAA